MYFYEVLERCDPDRLTEAFLKRCTGSPDIRQTSADFLGALEKLRRLSPHCSGEMTIVIEPAEGLDGVPFDAVRAVRPEDPVHYGLELRPWADTLGYLADADSLARCGFETYAALILWEMTFFGFDEKTIREKKALWEEA